MPVDNSFYRLVRLRCALADAVRAVCSSELLPSQSLLLRRAYLGRCGSKDVKTVRLQQPAYHR